MTRKQIIKHIVNTHGQFARQNKFNKEDIQGAGFIDFGTNNFVCYGKSISLDIKSRNKEDSAIANKSFGI
jgi:hypothetical protein